jgi:hypothetical protein
MHSLAVVLAVGASLLASQAVPAKQEARCRTEDSRLRSTSDRSVSVHPAHAFGSHPALSSAAATVSGNPQVTLRTTDCSSAGELPRPSRERSGRLRGNPIGGSGTILSEGRGEPRPTLRNSVSASATALRLRLVVKETFALMIVEQGVLTLFRQAAERHNHEQLQSPFATDLFC